MRRNFVLISLLSMPLLWACESNGSPDAVARAAGHELTVDAAAELISGQAELPAEADVVRALAELWMDYTLLATAAVEDSTLGGVDMSPVVQQQLDQRLVLRLREQEVQPDTAITDDELRQRYLEDLPGARVRARHILLSLPQDPTSSQRDSVLTLANQLRQRILDGEDFEQLAVEFSADRGSGQRGGDLGFFTRGQMVQPFEEAAFSLEPGQVSEPVESPFGVHIIRVEERELPQFEESQQSFRAQVQARRVFEAESTYIANLQDRVGLTVLEGATEAVRELVQRPNADLTRRAAGRKLAEFEGGSYTVADFLKFVRTRPPAFANQVEGSSDEQLENMVRNLARGKLLLAEARRLGITPAEDEEETLAREARNRLLLSVAQTGFLTISPREGETVDEAVSRTVMGYLEMIVRGDRDVVPLGPLAASLRDHYGARIYPETFDVVVSRIGELRSEEAPSATEPMPEPQEPQPADTTS